MAKKEKKIRFRFVRGEKIQICVNRLDVGEYEKLRKRAEKAGAVLTYSIGPEPCEDPALFSRTIHLHWV